MHDPTGSLPSKRLAEPSLLEHFCKKQMLKMLQEKFPHEHEIITDFKRLADTLIATNFYKTRSEEQYSTLIGIFLLQLHLTSHLSILLSRICSAQISASHLQTSH